MDIEKAKKAIEEAQDVDYTQSTKGFSILKSLIEKEISWAFEKSVSPQFKQEVKEKSEVYFEHYGYVNGLRQIFSIIDKINRNGETAAKDLTKWESKTNQQK